MDRHFVISYIHEINAIVFLGEEHTSATWQIVISVQVKGQHSANMPPAKASGCLIVGIGTPCQWTLTSVEMASRRVTEELVTTSPLSEAGLTTKTTGLSRPSQDEMPSTWTARTNTGNSQPKETVDQTHQVRWPCCRL